MNSKEHDILIKIDGQKLNESSVSTRPSTVCESEDVSQLTNNLVMLKEHLKKNIIVGMGDKCIANTLKQLSGLIEKHTSLMVQCINEVMESISNIYSHNESEYAYISGLQEIVKKLEHCYMTPRTNAVKAKCFKVKRIESSTINKGDSQQKYFIEEEPANSRPKSKKEKIREHIEKSKHII